MPLRLIYRTAASGPVELDGLLPSVLRGRPRGEIERLPVWRGNRQVPLAELFQVSGQADEGLVLEGDLSGAHGIGRGLEQGWVRVIGPAGGHVGASMTGGEIRVEGPVGDWAGAEMRGGLLAAAAAGDYLGGAYYGSPQGMTGGTIVVDANAGDQPARTMRRGLIVVGGSVGSFAALDMIAGSLVVLGGCGRAAAAGMRRGTLAVLGTAAPLLPSFQRGSQCQLQFMRLYLVQLRKLGVSVSEELLAARYRLYHGDSLSGGRGEVLVREA